MNADKADTIAAAAVLIRTVAVTAVMIRTFASDLLPSQLQDYLSTKFSSFFSHLSSDLTITIDELDGGGNVPNAMYKSAETYLSTKLTPSIRRIRVSKQQQDDEDEGGLDVAVDRDQEVVDTYCGIKFRWRLVFKEGLPRRRRNGRSYYTDHTAFEARSFELTVHKKHKEAALKRYLPHVISRAKVIREEAKALRLYTNEEDAWNAVNLRHPATFATMAMDVELKEEVMEDLARFVKRKEYYRRVGKAWKRGYLLYGPPGTGKSSLVAAMANFLRFDVYDLELTEVKSNSGLKSLLVGMTNQSILVVEDIDCAEGVGPREKGESEFGDDKVTLSGLLNFVDGLWSSCGDERIIVFTTNHKDRLDPALLRPGRMDVHIHMSYCTMSGFRVLASNYHYIGDHQLFGEIEALIKEVEITPAEVAEELMKSDDAEVALPGLIKVLKEKKKKSKETKEAQEENRDP